MDNSRCSCRVFAEFVHRLWTTLWIILSLFAVSQAKAALIPRCFREKAVRIRSYPQVFHKGIGAAPPPVENPLCRNAERSISEHDGCVFPIGHKYGIMDAILIQRERRAGACCRYRFCCFICSAGA